MGHGNSAGELVSMPHTITTLCEPRAMLCAPRATAAHRSIREGGKRGDGMRHMQGTRSVDLGSITARHHHAPRAMLSVARATAARENTRRWGAWRGIRGTVKGMGHAWGGSSAPS